MNSNVYRWCAVPQCNNTSIKTPNKLFINVPITKKVRNTWLNLARRDPVIISPNSVLYFCEDSSLVSISILAIVSLDSTIYSNNVSHDFSLYFSTSWCIDKL